MPFSGVSCGQRDDYHLDCGAMGDTQNCVPHIGVAVDENDVERGAMRILEQIRPEWEKDSVEFKVRPPLFNTFRVVQGVSKIVIKKHAFEIRIRNCGCQEYC